MLAQDSKILNLQDHLQKSHVAQELYSHQALKADMVPPRRRCYLVSSDADNAFAPDQLYQQLIWARDDIQFRDCHLPVRPGTITGSAQSTPSLLRPGHVLTSSSELLALHVTSSTAKLCLSIVSQAPHS